MNRILGAMWQMGLCLVLAVVLTGCGKSEPKEKADGKSPASDSEQNPNANPELSTPEKTIVALTKADEKRDYANFCQYFTDDAQLALAGGLLFSAKFLTAIISGREPDEMSEEDKAVVEATNQLLKKHKLDHDLDMQMNAQPEDQQKLLIEVGKKIEKPCEFITDFIVTMRKHGQNPDARMFPEDAHLDLVVTEGNHSKAELVFTRESKELRREVELEKVAGEWRISKIPDVLFK